MTQERKEAVAQLMSQIDVELHNYVLVTLKNLHFAQDALNQKAKALDEQSEEYIETPLS